MMLYFCIAGAVFLLLIPSTLWLVGWITGKISGFHLPYRHFGYTAIALVAIFWSVMAYGYHIGRWNLQTVKMEYSHRDIPDEFDGFRIVHISDLHLGTFDGHHEKLERIVSTINSLSPDLICFTGDLVTIGKEEAEPCSEILRGMNASYGVCSVLGNHDFLIYGSDGSHDREDAVNALAEFQRTELGWNVLRNQSMTISSPEGRTMTIIGVDNINCSSQGFKTISRGCLKKAMEDTEGFRILLSHDPSHWSSEVVPDTDIQLTLSGHTHAAQVRLFGWTPATLSFVETDGRYDRDGQTLYINIGLGCTVPFRLGAAPEITLITLHSED